MWFEAFLKDEDFFHDYQPIISLKEWTIIGYEALFRSNLFPSPEAAFDLAKRREKLYELDTGSIYKAISTFNQVKGFDKGKLFINVFSSVLMNNDFPEFIKHLIDEFTIPSQRLVIEITESDFISSFDDMVKVLKVLKSFGIAIAIDDIGKGRGEIQKIVEFEPEFLKLDTYFSRDLVHSKRKQTIIKFFKFYTEKFNCHFILEGLETPEEVAFAKFLGVHLAQGFALGKPEEL